MLVCLFGWSFPTCYSFVLGPWQLRLATIALCSWGWLYINDNPVSTWGCKSVPLILVQNLSCSGCFQVKDTVLDLLLSISGTYHMCYSPYQAHITSLKCSSMPVINCHFSFISLGHVIDGNSCCALALTWLKVTENGCDQINILLMYIPNSFLWPRIYQCISVRWAFYSH